LIKTDRQMKNTIYFLWLLIAAGLFTSCETTEQVVRYDGRVKPFYTSVEKAVNLRAGMNKEEARQTLGVYPFDILHNQFDGCEIHHYLYAYAMRDLPKEQEEKWLTQGERREVSQNDLYLIFRDGLLETFFSGSGKDAKPLLELKDDLKYVCNNDEFLENKRGCTDPEALNYDPEATIDDGSARYCPCGYVKNPWYNAERPCGEEECITEEELKRRTCEELCDEGFVCDCEEGKGGKKGRNGITITQEEECSLCDVLDKAIASPHANVEIKMNVSPNDLKTTTITTEGAGTSTTIYQNGKQVIESNEQEDAPKGLLKGLGIGGNNKDSGKPTSSAETDSDKAKEDILTLQADPDKYEKYTNRSKKLLSAGVPMFLVGVFSMTSGGVLMGIGTRNNSTVLRNLGTGFVAGGVPFFGTGLGLMAASGTAKRKAKRYGGSSLTASAAIWQTERYAGNSIMNDAAAGFRLSITI
jgi:outer membrane protein assembly factor BamE (lipoprotein component of BamABCDE complex)